MIASYLLLLFLFQNGCSIIVVDRTDEATTSEATATTTSSENDVVECYSEIKGQFIGQPFDDPITTVGCTSSHYCQKITANYLTIAGETHVTMKGCDQMNIPGIFQGIECDYEGCFERSIKDELYNICCCEGELCNGSSYWRCSFLIIIIAIYILLSN